MSDKVVISEHFTSIQGEGSHIGKPSVFIRVFGCNLSCPGFGQPRGKLIPIEDMPHNTFDVSGITSMNQLPVVTIGCDSSAAWSKKYRHLATSHTSDELYDIIMSDCDDKYDLPDLVITGGEPLLKKYQRFWPKLLSKLPKSMNVTFETNGTQELLPEFIESIADNSIRTNRFTFSVSPKLSISGEPSCKSIKPDVIKQYTDVCKNSDNEIYLKFVIRDEIDIVEVKDVITKSNFDKVVYLMPEGATLEGVELTERSTADLAIKHGYWFTPRLHINLFGNNWGT